MTYDTYGPRTRFSVYWTLALLIAPALAMAIERWSTSGRWRDGIDVLWVVGVAAATLRLLTKLGRLERQHADPDGVSKGEAQGMHLAFEAIALLPVFGVVPFLAAAAARLL